ncbi:translation elongation factor 4 [Companilactobacillus zhongbaensis]|uniref:translation elongation factor 4 n=1 Tax=Companilactobacillus zhongbaensis TaxID=2486009 RepID=UPI000F78D3CB|nr:translation elongation factor 4 [Companilactobacillus zhongbaensis]
MDNKYIRNFAIIAHIDHGKSTLAYRIMELTETVSKRNSQAQLLDDMTVEKDHDVTVKAKTVQNYFISNDGSKYEYNLIDTPGHVDFNYEVSKSLAACEGAILLVDATQGVQAQTVANYRIAKKNNLKIIPVINKIDIASADIESTQSQLNHLDKSFNTNNTYLISAKSGEGVAELLEAIKTDIPAPQGSNNKPLKALIFDSIYDSYQGIIAYVRLIDGHLQKDQDLLLMQSNKSFKSKNIGIFDPNMDDKDNLNAGEVGFIVTGLKDPKAIRVGDTVTSKQSPTKKTVSGYSLAHQMVFAGIFPKNDDYSVLKDAILKLSLNDTSFTFVEENSDALGMGYRCGFLGAFHLQIIRERLKDEFGLDVLTTAPNVHYQVHLKNGSWINVDNPIQFPDFGLIQEVKEPFMKGEITVPNDNLNDVLKLINEHKGQLIDLGNNEDLITINIKIPLSEIIYNFFSELKSVSHGYANLNVTFLDFEVSDIVKVEVDMNYSPVDALSFIVHRSDISEMTQNLVHKLKYVVPRELYPIPVQAIVEGKSVARVDVPPLRKNVAVNGENRSTSKKAALLRRQSLNKRRSAKNQIKLPQNVFNAILEL